MTEWLNWAELSMAPPVRTRSSFPLSQSLPSGRFHKPLILLHQREDRLKNTITENQPIWSHGPQPCLTQWNYDPCRVGPPKMDGSWWRVLTKRGPLEKGMANQYSCLENPMNSMKKQKYRTLKDEIPRLVGAQYATGDQWRTNSRKNEDTEPNNTQLWMWLVMEVKSDAVKSNIA